MQHSLLFTASNLNYLVYVNVFIILEGLFGWSKALKIKCYLLLNTVKLFLVKKYLYLINFDWFWVRSVQFKLHKEERERVSLHQLLSSKFEFLITCADTPQSYEIFTHAVA